MPAPAKVLAGRPAAAAPIARFEPAAISVDGKLYLFGGFDRYPLLASARGDVYDPAADSWSRLPDMPSTVTHAGAALADGVIWIAGGFSGHHPGPATRAVWRYHIASRAWSPGPLLPESRAAGALVFLGGELHFLGGLLADRQTDSSSHWALKIDSAAAQWQHRAPLVPARNHFSAAVVNGKIHAMGGQHGHDLSFKDIALHDVYDPRTDSWAKAAALLLPRSHSEPGTMVHGGAILISGGRSNEIPVLHDIHAYYPAADRWEPLAGLPVPMRAPVVRIFGEALYAGLGGVTATGVMPTADWSVYPLAQLGFARGDAQ